MSAPFDLPIISMWMPWSNWAALRWKTCETRLHDRFKRLAGKRIGIHSALKWDDEALAQARPFLSAARCAATDNFLRIGGAIICTAFVKEARWLTHCDEPAALIECETPRFGLFLEDVQLIDAIPVKGKQGIWYYREKLERDGQPQGETKP